LKAASRIVALVSVAIALVGCDLETPEIVSGVVTASEAGRSASNTVPVKSVSELNAWLKEHRGGWSKSVATYVPRISTQLKAKDGSTWGLNILESLVVVNGGGAQLTQSFSAEQLAPLKGALGVKQ
jgi:hypothetical protein